MWIRSVEGFLSRVFLSGALLLLIDDPAAALDFEKVPNPPAVLPGAPSVQMHVPGFSVRELPLTLNNINNLVVAPDGRIFALGYNGQIWILRDTDGDGIEDESRLYWNNKAGEIPASIGMCWGRGGLYIATRGRLLHLKDQPGGSPVLETAASGWVPPAKFGGSNLDAVGVAVDREENVYFGLGCDDWTGAYRVNPQGTSDYNIQSERGTILKVSSDWKRREIVATGLRWTVSLAFNASGDLFCTDQEGATWLPNGNPFDELLRIERGRHYGFPPRHPKFLPNVVDEPSLFDYAPQHQSACGLHFNELAPGISKTFGPSWWRGDAIVSGESRGKIWRTRLVKGSHGYVAQNQLIATLKMLTVDAAPTPDGGLLVSCHSGAPDWGTGPQGKGKLYKIRWIEPESPQPVIAWSESQTETRVLFDRALDLGQLKQLRETRIEFGPYVGTADHFESIRPGYQVVKDQMGASRFSAPVLSASVLADGRTLSFRTAPRVEAYSYSLSVPARLGRVPTVSGDLELLPVIDVGFSLAGVEADWEAGKDRWHGWIPHLDSAVSRQLLQPGSAKGSFGFLRGPGKLRLRTQLDLGNMIHPAVQPGAKLDFEYPSETVTLVFESPDPIRISAPGKIAKDGKSVSLTVSAPTYWIPLDITLTALRKEPELQVSWHTSEDPRPRSLPLKRMLLPWAKAPGEGAALSETPRHPELSGANGENGRRIFFGEKAGCSKCHRVDGAGGNIGPDLSNLVHRDYESVLRDIREPNAAINPENLAYSVRLKDGETVDGIISKQDDSAVWVADAQAKVTRVSRSEIDSIKASAISLMPAGLLDALSTSEQKDLLGFLLIRR